MKAIFKIFILVFICVTATACRSKKKLVDRQNETTEINTLATAEDLHKTDVNTETAVASKTTFLKVDSHSSINLTQADPDKKIIIEDATGAVMKITGANAIISKGSTKEQKTDTMSAVSKTADKSVTQKKTAQKTSIKKDINNRKTNSEAKGVSIGFYIGLLIIVLLIIIFRGKIYELYKKVLPGIKRIIKNK